MAIGNFGMPLNQHRAPTYDIRTRPSKYAMSDIRSWRFEQSEGIRPAAYYAPYKYLPVGFQDIATEDWVVIPKGRIVSAVGAADSTPISGIVYPSSSGYINVGKAAPELGSSLIKAQIDHDFFGYDMNITSLLVPCNGGTISSGYYTADDVSAETIVASGGYATASGAFILPANAPIGVVYHDWYQDVRGKWLNYKMHRDGGHILTDWFVEVPYIKKQNTLATSGYWPRWQNHDYAAQLLWKDVNDKFTYLSVDGDTDTFTAGTYVVSDLIGNYKLQGAPTLLDGSGLAVTTGFGAFNMPATNQTVGKILEIDNRFPKAGLEDVQTYPRSGMPGTQTAGLPKFLFDFAYECLRIGGGSAPTVEAVYNAVRNGTFGLVRIQLLVS